MNSIANLAQLTALLKGNQNGLVVLHAWADWCEPCKQIDSLLSALSKQHPQVAFGKVEAEQVVEVSEKYNIASVPTVLFFRAEKEVGRVEGAFPSQVAAKLTELAGNAAEPEEEKHRKLERLINSAPVMLFMKGVPDEPRCGFSNKMVQVLRENNIIFSYFNILADEEVRQGLKSFSNWPTYPQLYINGKLVGGLDIVNELVEDSSLDDMVPETAKLNNRLTKLINNAKVMLFMKGTPSEPRCGFSKKIVEILQDHKIEFSSFDILTDNTIRQGLKTFSNWPTYPQLYASGKLIGGLDIVKELADEGELCDALK